MTHYRVAIKDTHSYFSEDGWSGYGERWRMMTKDQLPEGEQVYGYEQALEHVKELREHMYDGKKIYKDSKFIITTVVTVETSMESPV